MERLLEGRAFFVSFASHIIESKLSIIMNDLFSFPRHEEVNFPSLQNEKDRFLSYWLS